MVFDIFYVKSNIFRFSFHYFLVDTCIFTCWKNKKIQQSLLLFNCNLSRLGKCCNLFKLGSLDIKLKLFFKQLFFNKKTLTKLKMILKLHFIKKIVINIFHQCVWQATVKNCMRKVFCF